VGTTTLNTGASLSNQ
nr:NADPH-dependent aldehyde reductase {N-terminal} {EC 1.1.1.2} [Sporobolomyces salmonicolor, AKU 4429, Peptide Partial, 15 aa] [Sporobolomyces salmonicolor]